MICWQPHWFAVMKILIFIGTILLSLLNQCETQMQARRSDMGAFIDSVLGAYLVSKKRISLWLLMKTIFFSLNVQRVIFSGQASCVTSLGPRGHVMCWKCGLKLGTRELGNANKCQVHFISPSTPYAVSRRCPLGGARVVANGRGVGDAG